MMAQLKDLLVMGPGRIIGDAFFGGQLMPTITETQDIGSSSIKWNNIYGNLIGNSDTATALETARAIDGILFDGSADINRYGTTDTAAGTTAKVVTLPGFKLYKGSIAIVFSNVRNTVSYPTYNINGTGAKALYYGATKCYQYRNISNTLNTPIPMIYDGTNYQYLTANPPITFFASNPGSSVGASGSAFTYGYFPIFSRESTDAATMPYMLYSFEGMRIDYSYGTTSSKGSSILKLGSWNIKSTAAKNMRGQLELAYSFNRAILYPDITPNEANVSAHNPTFWHLPDLGETDRTFASIAHDTATGSETQPVYVASDGTIASTTYNLNATITEGTANNIAYYTSNNEIGDTDSAQIIDGYLHVTDFAVSGESTFNGNVYLRSSTDADSLTTGSLVVSGNTSLVNTTSAADILPHSTNSRNLGSTSLRWAKLYIGDADTYGSNTTAVYWNAGVPKAVDVSVTKAGAANYLAYYDAVGSIKGTSSVQIINGCLNLYPTSNSYREGMRIHPYNGWSDITLMGNTNTNTSNIAATDWFIGNNNGVFYLTHNGSSSSTTGYMKVSGSTANKGTFEFYNCVGINGTNNTYNLYVNGTSYLNGPFTIGNVQRAITGTGTTASDAGSGENRYKPALWTFSLSTATPAAGDIITIKIPCAGHTYGVFVSTDAGTTYYPVSIGTGTSRLTTHYASGNIISLFFDSAGSTADMFPVEGATARRTISGGCWRVLNFYDSNSNDVGYYILSNGFRMNVGSNKIFPYTLFAQVSDGSYESFVTSSSNGTSKTRNTHGFLPTGKIYWNPNNSTYDVGLRSFSPYEQYHSIDYRYSFNITTSGLPASVHTYIKYTYDAATNLLYLAENWLATALPTTDDGFIYQRIGSNYYGSADYRGSLILNNTYYKFENDQLTVWTGGTVVATAAALTTTTNAVAYYTDTKGTLGAKASANGALYATSTDGALQWGTLPIAQGGTGKTTASDAWTALGGGASGKHADSYFVKAITSTDNAIVRFDGTNGQVQNSTAILDDNGCITLTHIAGKSSELKIIYGSTISMWWGVGTANENHGLYDDKANKWILSAGAANTWTFVGNVTGNVTGNLTGNVTGNVTGNLYGTADYATTVRAILSNTEKLYVLGTTTTLSGTGQNVSVKGDSGVYMTSTAGALSAVRHYWNESGTEKAYAVWNEGSKSIDFYFI